MTAPEKKPSLLRWREIPGGVWALGFVSLFMDASSEMIHAVLPLYLVGVLGASTLEVGMIEGVAEATAAIAKIFSGVISDWLGNRKWLTAAGYGPAALSKPLFPLAPDVSWVGAARFIDRVAKGIRGSPRDALIADLTPDNLRGTAYGLRQSLDTVGAFIGPGAAILLMALFADDFRSVFWVAVIRAFLSVAVILLFVREPQRAVKKREQAPLFGPIARASYFFWPSGPNWLMYAQRLSRSLSLLIPGKIILVPGIIARGSEIYFSNVSLFQVRPEFLLALE